MNRPVVIEGPISELVGAVVDEGILEKESCNTISDVLGSLFHIHILHQFGGRFDLPVVLLREY